MRAPSSAAPPGGKGTISRIGLLGYWAAAAAESRNAARAVRILVMASLRLDARGREDAAIALHLLLHERRELARRRRAQGECLALHRRLHVRPRHGIDEFLVEPLHHVARHTAGAEKPGPGGDRELRHARFGD